MKSTNKKNAFSTLLSQWWLSAVLLLCSWFIVKQFYLAINSNILLAVNYDHVIPFSYIYFVMDTVTLIIHEAGHTIFGIFGWRFLTILGGTLIQLILPTLIVIYGLINQKDKIIQLSMYWLGFSYLDTSVYAADAYYKQLPLLGNLPATAHDFANLLSHLNILDHYKLVANSFFYIGCVILILAIAVPYFSANRAQKVYIALNV